MDATDDRVVIQYPWKGSLIGGVLSSLVLFVVLYFQPNGSTTAAWVFSALVLFASIGEKFRKLEISRDGIVYRRQFGRPRRVQFADLSAIQKTKVGRWNSGRVPVPGMEMQYPNSNFLLIPLDLPDSDKIYDKIFKAWEAQRAAR